MSGIRLTVDELDYARRARIQAHADQRARPSWQRDYTRGTSCRKREGEGGRGRAFRVNVANPEVVEERPPWDSGDSRAEKCWPIDAL